MDDQPEKGSPGRGERLGLGSRVVGEYKAKVDSAFGSFGQIDDPWIAAYTAYLDREIRALSAGPIGLHYLNCAMNATDRLQAWVAIRACCQWLIQLETEEFLNEP
jgi:hypothetical protein